MEPRTSKKAYKNHQYSGRRINRKRSRGQMKRYYGVSLSRNEVWCKKMKSDNTDVSRSALALVPGGVRLATLANITSTMDQPESQCPESVPGDETEMEDEVPKVCRACLASGVRMFDVAAGGLQDTFECVTGAELYTSDERPRHVCFVCCSQLQRFRAFCQMSRKAETYLTKLLKKGLQVTEQEVSKRHRSIKPKLNVTKNPLIAIHTLEDSNECASVEVKNEEQDNNIRDSETESETEFGSEVKTGTHISKRENEREESLLDLETEREIKIDEIDIEELDPLEDVKHTTVRDEACLQCAEAFPSQSELLKHVQFHTQKKLKQANSNRRNVKAKIIKRNIKTKLESQCKFCNMTFAIKTQLVTHVATEHGIGELSEAQTPKRRILKTY